MDLESAFSIRVISHFCSSGEANANYNTDLYNCTFPEKIKDWRAKWHGGFEPYGFVQLANFVGNGGVTVRWHQTADYGYTPNPSMENVFMAVAIDTYDEPSGIHPRLVIILMDIDIRCELNSPLLWVRIFELPLYSVG